jgi:hypothetical protein
LEPVSTLDVDVFIAFKPRQESIIVSPAPIFGYLKRFGCKMEGEYIVISGWPVQFLPASGPLLEDALDNAGEVDVEGVPARVLTAEYLAAVALFRRSPCATITNARTFAHRMACFSATR